MTPGEVTCGSIEQFQLPRSDDTRLLGESIGRLLRAGDLVILTGALGAGKTVLAQGIGAGMGVLGTVMSPTFVIARVHRSAVPGGVGLVHVDAYRLGGAVELDDLDLDTELAVSAVVVEWGAGVAEQLSDGHLRIDLERRDDDSRLAVLTPNGGDWPARIATLTR